MNGPNVTLTSRDARGSDGVSRHQHAFKKHFVRENTHTFFFFCFGSERERKKTEQRGEEMNTESNKERTETCKETERETT